MYFSYNNINEIENCYSQIKDFKMGDQTFSFKKTFLDEFKKYSMDHKQLVAMCFLLIQQTENTNYTSSYGNDVFKACRTGRLSSVKWLFENKNWDPKQQEEIHDPKNDMYENDFAIHIATRNGHLSIVQYLIQEKKAGVHQIGYYDYTPLHYACMYGHFLIAQYLISVGANIDTRDAGGINSLYYACRNGHLPIVELLVSHGADILTKYDNDDSFIHIAAQDGHLDIIKYLIEKQYVDKDLKGNDERTPLYYACSKGHLPIVEYLISLGANIEAIDSYFKYTPLLTASRFGRTDIVKFLIEKGADDTYNSYGRTAYSIANKIEIKKFLIKSK